MMCDSEYVFALYCSVFPFESQSFRVVFFFSKDVSHLHFVDVFALKVNTRLNHTFKFKTTIMHFTVVK